MGARSPITLGQLFDRLGFTLLSVSGQAYDPHVAVEGLAIPDSLDPQPVPPASLVLGVGLPDGEHAARFIRECGTANATGVVLRESLLADPDVAAAITDSGVPVFGLVGGASWVQVASILESALRFSDGRVENPEMFGDAETDLFSLANSIAELMEGPVTIEDSSSRIIAFSADQYQADDARKESVLGHKVPESYNRSLRERGIFQKVYASSWPVYIEPLGPDVRARVAMRLQVGGEILGSIWIVVDHPQSDQRLQGLVEAANVVALTMLRARIANDSATRLRSALVASLIEGGSSARVAASKAGLATGPSCVIALGLRAASDSVLASDLSIHRLAKTFDLYLRAAYPNAQAALLGETIYTVLPLGQLRKEEIALQCANGFVTRLRRPSDVVAGIGLPVEDVSQLSTSRREADMTLRVLRSREYQDGTPLVANISDVQVESLLLRMADSLKDSNESLSGPLRVLHQHDTIHKSELVATLEAWLNFFGDVAKAAISLNIHKNTFRYRLRRVSEIAGVDLSDPAERFGLMLQLRLFS